MNIFLLNTLEGGIDLFSILNERIDIKGYIGLNENKDIEKKCCF